MEAMTGKSWRRDRENIYKNGGEEESRRLDATMTADGATSMEQALAAHMWENYQSVKSRLAEAIENKNKRIEIKY